jgi:NAD(P)-dependent dehydrogenase (short-subunit alcohol dehydrogenase family)
MILPGRTVTDLGGLRGEARRKFLVEGHVGIPAGRMGRPEDYGGIAVYLASDASVFHTGDLMTIDGGQSLTV